ncbi:hypothetical protein [Acinetobacter sp.]|uniref:hypothetical protein n=1 Tax=Acinetobacter sp. TaxID=472 RepID=UPI0035AF6478
MPFLYFLAVDDTPIGGFDNVLLDEVLGLSALGLRSVVIMVLGCRSTADFNADLPKACLSKEAVIHFLQVIAKAILYFQKI